MTVLTNERGAILITVLILMVIIALIGTFAVNTSTVEIQISGNLKRTTSAFEGAEAGVGLSVPIIEKTLAVGTLDPTSFTVGSDTVTPVSSLGNEIIGAAMTNVTEDFEVPSLDGVKVEADIDRLYSYTLPGGAMQFAAGYEGVGASAAGAGVGVLYRIKSKGTR